MKRFYKIISLVLAAVLLTATGAGLFSVPAEAADGKWVAAWGSSLVNGSVSVAGASFQDVILAGSTLRTDLTVTTGGSKLVFMFSNQYGSSAVTITEASVAKSNPNVRAGIVEGTQTPITFGGQTSVTIPAGKRVQSDEISFTTKSLDPISVSLYFKDFTYMTSVGLSNGRTFMRRMPLSTSSQINAAKLTNASEVNIGSGAIVYHTIPFLERIDTYSTDKNACTAVFIGDSTLVNDTYLYYAKRIVSAGVKNISVINEAIIGNKLLSNGSGVIGNLYGPAMIDRFQRDVLDMNGVKYCFVKIGLNDVLHQNSKTLAATTPKYSAEEIIAGYKTLVQRCHERGIKIYFFTKSAWMGYERNFLGSGVDITWTQSEQDMCDKLTQWVLTNKEADGYIDCSPLADPSDPRKLCSTFTPDGAHLTDLGSIALADLIPLEYVGVKSSAGKTAAQLTGTDPYAEKRQIIRDMEEAARNTTAPATEPEEPATEPDVPATVPDEPAATVPYQQPVTQPIIITPTAESFTFASETEPTSQVVDPYTVPNYTNPYATEPAGDSQNVTYNVSDDKTVTSVGSGTRVGVVLLFVLSVSVAAAVVILTMMKKKEA
jgi:hypothetical protein